MDESIGVTDAELLRRYEHALTQAGVNRASAQIAKVQSAVADNEADGDWLRDRAQRAEREARRLESEAERLRAEIERRGLQCSMGADSLCPAAEDCPCSRGDDGPCSEGAGCSCPGREVCACARCEEDGPVTRIMGDPRTHLVVVRGDSADCYSVFTERPRRRPFTLRRDRDGRWVTQDRGKAREEHLRVLEGILGFIEAVSRRGREPGYGIDRDWVVQAIDDLREAGETVKAAATKVAKDQLYATESVLGVYYRRRPNPDLS